VKWVNYKGFFHDINQNANMNDPNSDDAKTLSLFETVLRGRVGRVAKLLADGVDINEKTVYHRFGPMSPLQIAVGGFKLEMTKLLIDKGADMSVLFANGESLLMWLTQAPPFYFENKVVQMAGLLIDNGADLYYKRNISYPVLECLTKHNCVSVSNNWNVLHMAAYHGRFQIVRVLVNHGADILVKTPLGETALDLALKYNDLEKYFPGYGRNQVERYKHEILNGQGFTGNAASFLERVEAYDDTVRFLKSLNMKLALSMSHHPHPEEPLTSTRIPSDLIKRIAELLNSSDNVINLNL